MSPSGFTLNLSRPSHSVMVPGRNRVFLWTGPVVALGWPVVILLDPSSGGRLMSYVAVGYLLGTLLGQTTLAAAWTALGPEPLVIRLPLSLIWVAILVIVLASNIALHGGPAEAPVVLGACLLGQWLLVQLLLWPLVLGFGLRLRQPEELARAPDLRERQFGIGQLMVITAVVAVVLGIGRAVMSHLGDRMFHAVDTPVLIFLAVAAIVPSLPMLLGALLPARAGLAVAATTALMAVATFLELPLLGRWYRVSGPDLGHIVWINLFTAAWVLAVGGIVRRAGWRVASAGGGKLGQKTTGEL